MLPSYSNKGRPVRAYSDVAIMLYREGADGRIKKISNSILAFDWSGYSAAKWTTEALLAASVVTTNFNLTAVHFLQVVTDAPVTIEFTQDAELRKFTVTPSVQPVNFFQTDLSPTTRPLFFQKGVFVASGSAITGIVLRGVTGVRAVANVKLLVAGIL